MKAKIYTKETILNLGVYDRNFPDFNVGDTVIVTTKVKDFVSAVKKGASAKAHRNQSFEGIVLAIKHFGIAKTFTVRKIMDGISIERVFPYYSPQVLDLQLKEEGDVRRAKLYYLRDRYGKKSEVKRKKKVKIVLANKVQSMDSLEATSTSASVSSVSAAL